MGRETLSVDRLQRPQVLGPGLSGRAAPSSGAFSALGGGGSQQREGTWVAFECHRSTGEYRFRVATETGVVLPVFDEPPTEHAPTLIASKLGHGGSSAEEPEAEMSPQSS